MHQHLGYRKHQGHRRDSFCFEADLDFGKQVGAYVCVPSDRPIVTVKTGKSIYASSVTRSVVNIRTLYSHTEYV